MVEKVMEESKSKVFGYAKAGKSGGTIRNAEVILWRRPGKSEGEVEVTRTRTNSEGRYEIEFVPEAGRYFIECAAFGKNKSDQIEIVAGATLPHHVVFDFGLAISLSHYKKDDTQVATEEGVVGKRLLALLENDGIEIQDYHWSAEDADVAVHQDRSEADFVFRSSGEHKIWVEIKGAIGETTIFMKQVFVSQVDVKMVGGRVNVTLERTATPPTLDQALWCAIRDRTAAISFEAYRNFIDMVMKGGHDFLGKVGNEVLDPKFSDLRNVRHGVRAYELLKLATQVFLLLRCGVKIEPENRRDDYSFECVEDRLHEYLGDPPQLPYIKQVVKAVFSDLKRDGLSCDCVLSAAHAPCLIELIKEYFLEEGMLMQTMNAVAMRFQNVHGPGDRDPLANLEIDPLRPLGNILWGRGQDLHLLSVRRRAYEYMHQYGLSLYGKATTSMHPADNRSRFLEAFHNLLYLCSVFFKEDNDTTVIADGYPLLNAIKEVHLILAQGAHNQFGDLPWTARVETLVQQWILAQPEMREFLQSRIMVPYTEAWMPQVDTMKTLQGWSDVSVTYFRDLAEYGERIVLSLRYGNWTAYVGENHAKNWARFFRADIQAYLHGYRAVTGVDLTNPDSVDATLPAIHLQKRLALQTLLR